jgi:MYXO-CTERM domain-containing protein
MKNISLFAPIAFFAGAILMAPVVGHASILFSIDDLTDVVSIVGISPYGFDPTSLNTQTNGENSDLHGEYLSSLNLTNGASIVVNFDFLEPAFEPNAGLPSDTLNIVFTGHTPVAGVDVNNISVDLHFRSDVDPNSLPPLANPINLTETGAFQPLGSLIAQNGGPGDFQVPVRSDVVPEQGSFTLLGTGLLLALAGHRRRRK